jgi:hypothetical protein
MAEAVEATTKLQIRRGSKRKLPSVIESLYTVLRRAINNEGTCIFGSSECANSSRPGTVFKGIDLLLTSTNYDSGAYDSIIGGVVCR